MTTIKLFHEKYTKFPPRSYVPQVAWVLVYTDNPKRMIDHILSKLTKLGWTINHVSYYRYGQDEFIYLFAL